MLTFNVAAGPMSREIVEAVFHYSTTKKVQVALIASKNQIDYDSGYVENWSTYRFMEFVNAMRVVYPDAKVVICRDHCGPNFNNIGNLEDTYETIRVDIEQGFDLIHIDFCKMDARHDDQITEAILAIEYAKSLNPEIKFEIGTDEITGGLIDLAQLDNDIRRFKAVCDPEFYVINTGSHTLENRQVGTFDQQFASRASAVVRSYGMKVKEHNADFLTPEQIQLRRGIIDAVNIAPQLGVCQTRFSLMKAEENGVPFGDWCGKVYASEKWRKWLLPGTDPIQNRRLCVEAAGHYCFTDRKYEILREDLAKMAGVTKGDYINLIAKILDLYQTNLE